MESNQCHQGWLYNFYNPVESSLRFPQHYPVALSTNTPLLSTNTPPLSTNTPPVPDQQAEASIGLKVFSPVNKREFVMFKLRGVSASDLSTPRHLKELILKQVSGDVVSTKLDFPVGFLNKSDKFWINNELDMKDAREIRKLTFWCTGRNKARGKKRVRENDSDSDENINLPPKKGRSSAEERSSRVHELKAQLREKHSSSYSGVQYSLWAEMIVAGTHQETESPPCVPMFGSKRPRGRSSRLEGTLNDVAGKIANALSPTTSCDSSPIKSANLRGKYLQQLKEMVNLRELGALTEDEYQENRLVIVNLMKQL